MTKLQSVVCNDTPNVQGIYRCSVRNLTHENVRQYNNGPGRADTFRPGLTRSDDISARTRLDPLRFVNFRPAGTKRYIELSIFSCYLNIDVIRYIEVAQLEFRSITSWNIALLCKMQIYGLSER